MAWRNIKAENNHEKNLKLLKTTCILLHVKD